MDCLITGASLGIGRELAIKMASLGYNLYLTYYSNLELINKLKIEIEKKYKVKCKIKKCDLSLEEDIKELFKDIESLDVLVNNAATYEDNLIEDIGKSQFMKVLEVNVVGTFLVSRYALDKLSENGVIVNMSSTDGIDTYSRYNTSYAVSKAGIIQLTKSLAISTNKKVIAIAPNWVDTESTKMVDKNYLESELKRIGQERLIEVERVVDIIIDSINNQDIKSGDVIKIYE